jgi:hypothetical protein
MPSEAIIIDRCKGEIPLTRADSETVEVDQDRIVLTIAENIADARVTMNNAFR